MYPVLYNDSNERLAILDNIIAESDKIKRVVNGEYLFEFDAYEKELKSEYFVQTNYISIESQKFDIKYIQQKHSDSEVVYNIQCEHVNYRMADGVAHTLEKYSKIGTPTEILDDILAGTEFISGTIEYTNQITLLVNKEITRKGLIYELANVLGAEIDYTDGGFTINLLNSIGQNNGFVVRFGKNLKGITKIIDNRGELKTSYSVDLVELRNSNEYISKGLDSLEDVGVGDTIQVIDEVIGLDVTNKVVSIEYSPIYRLNMSMEISNTIELISDSIKKIDNEKLTIEGLYNGVKIGPDEGFVAERSDGKAKTIFNATEGISVYSDVGTGLVRNFYVDTNGNLIMRGSITVLGGSVPGTYITDNSISTGKIQADAITADKIDVLNLSAISANLGTITAGTINAVTINGATINIDDNVTIGQQLKLLDPNNSVAATFVAFKTLGPGNVLLDTLLIGGTFTVNNNTNGIVSYTELDRIDAFVDKILVYGSLYTSEGLSSSGDITTSRGFSNGGYFWSKNPDGENAAVLGLNSGTSYQTGLLFLYNGVESNSEARFQGYVDTSGDKGVLLLYRGDYISHELNSDSASGSYITMRNTSGVLSSYLGGNSGESQSGYLGLYNSSGVSQVDAFIDDGVGGILRLKSGADTKVYISCTSSGGSMTLYDGYGASGKVWFDGSNLMLTIGSTTYTITKS